jgi:hypothetical protein
MQITSTTYDTERLLEKQMCQISNVKENYSVIWQPTCNCKLIAFFTSFHEV